jgi:hypothetical protein
MPIQLHSHLFYCLLFCVILGSWDYLCCTVGPNPKSCQSYMLHVGSERLRTGVLLFLSLCFTLCSQDLASSVIATGKAPDFCKVLPSKAVHWLEENYPSVATKLQRFLDKYGHRCIKEVSCKLQHIWFDPSKWNETQNVANSQICRLWCSHGIHSVTEFNC